LHFPLRSRAALGKAKVAPPRRPGLTMRHLPRDIGEQIAYPPSQALGFLERVRRWLGLMPRSAGKIPKHPQNDPV